MITRTFKLCLNAGTGSAPFINVSQTDKDEVWLFELYTETGERYIPSSGAIIGIKSDGHGIANTGTVDSEGRVVITETEQMTAAAGRSIFELSIDGLTHGTANFIVNVEKKPIDGAIMSDSDLSLISQAIDSAAEIEDLLGGQDVPTVITPIISDWLDENITNPSNPPIDTSLTVAGAAADAKKTGDEISDLKSAINDFTETIYSINIFDQENATITEGKYLNPNTGNEGTNATYCYVNEYIPVDENTQYYGTAWSKSSGTLLGAFACFAVFYDANKGYLGGLSGSSTQNPFTTPTGCAYMRISMSITGYNSNNYMFEKGASASSQFVPYSVTHKLKLPLPIVDINGNGDFTSIATAVNTLPDGSVVLVMPGTYEENVKAWGKKIHIIGLSREACVIKDTSGNYATPPLEIGAGSVQNMSIIEQAEGAGTANMGAYAIHVESNNLYNKKLLIRNCYIYSDSSSAIGMGLRGGCSVRIEDCEIICAGARASTGAAPIYFHDADAQAYWGTANLYLHGNVLRNTASSLFSMLTINSIHKENTTYMHMMYNIFVRSKTPALPQKYNTWNTRGNTDADGWNGLSHMYLEDDSFGNNQTDMNYSA